MGNPLVDLAQQSGLFPDMFDPIPVQGPEYQNGVPQGAVTSPEVGPDTNPYAPIPTPSAAPMTPGMSTGKGTSSAYSVSTGGSGYSEKKKASIDKNDTQLQAGYNQAEGEAATAGQPMLNAETRARNEQVAATKGVADASIAKITNEGHQAMFMADLQGRMYEAEQEATMAASAQMAQAKTDYMAALADFRASKVDPSQLWGNMSGGQKFGTLVTAFVHDFLGVKGMHTSAMDTLNKAIDRNIDSQIQAIKVKGEVAEGFKSLWYMQRNQSASDAEARARVRTFLLEQAKQQVIANSAQFESGLASAQGQAAIAAIDKEYAKQLVEIYKHIDTNALSLRDQALRWQTTKINAANESYRNAIMAKNAETERQRLAFDKSKLNPLAEIQKGVIVDFQGNPYARFRAGIPEEIQKEVLLKGAATSTLIKDVEEYRQMMREYGSIKVPAMRQQFADEHSRQMLALQARIMLNEQMRVTGKQVNATEQSRIESQIPEKSAWTNGTVQNIVANFEKRGIQDYDGLVKTVGIDLSDTEKALIPAGAGGQYAKGNLTDATITGSGQADVVPPGEKARENAVGKIHGPKDSEVTKDYQSYSKQMHDEFVKSHPDIAKSMAKETKYDKLSGDPIPNAEVGITELYRQAKETDNSGMPTVDAIKAREHLENEANSWIQSTDLKDWRGGYSYWVLDKLKQENPAVFQGSKFGNPQPSDPLYGQGAQGAKDTVYGE